MKPFFSILVPIYNVDPYLSHCLESLIHQTFTNLQIICINDGSTDDSAQILDQYGIIDPRIQIFHQNNLGYGATLNRALTYAQGNYISIVEPDDYLSLNAYELFYDEIQKHLDADI